MLLFSCLVAFVHSSIIPLIIGGDWRRQLLLSVRVHATELGRDSNGTAKLTIGASESFVRSSDFPHGTHCAVYIGDAAFPVRLTEGPNIYSFEHRGQLSLNPSGIMVSQFGTVAVVDSQNLLLSWTEQDFADHHCLSGSVVRFPIVSNPMVTYSCSNGCEPWQGQTVLGDMSGQTVLGDMSDNFYVLSVPRHFSDHITSILEENGASGDVDFFYPCSHEMVRALPDLVMTFDGSGDQIVLSPDDYLDIEYDRDGQSSCYFSFRVHEGTSRRYRFNPFGLEHIQLWVNNTSITFCDPPH